MSTVRRLLKRAESVVQRELIRVASIPARSRHDTVDLRHPRRVLVVRHDWIGDMIMSTGFLRRIKQHHPQVDVDVVAGPSNAEVLDGLPFVRRIFVHRQGDTRHLLRLRHALRAEGYDAVLNGRVLRPKLTPDTALLLLASGAPHRIGVTGGGADFVYTDPVRPPADTHFVRQLAALTEPLGLDADAGDWRPELSIHPGEREAAERQWERVAGSGGRLLVNVSARHVERRWSDDWFVEALRRFRALTRDVRMLVVSHPSEFDRARAVADAVGGTAAPRGLLRGTFPLVAGADLVLTPDTSIAHVASAFVTPVVVLMQPGKEDYLPYRTPGRYVRAEGPTLDALPVEAVVGAMELVYTAGRRLEPQCLRFTASAAHASAASR